MGRLTERTDEPALRQEHAASREGGAECQPAAIVCNTGIVTAARRGCGPLVTGADPLHSRVLPDRRLDDGIGTCPVTPASVT